MTMSYCMLGTQRNESSKDLAGMGRPTADNLSELKWLLSSSNWLIRSNSSG
jgi:hypothetical protein